MTSNNTRLPTDNSELDSEPSDNFTVFDIEHFRSSEDDDLWHEPDERGELPPGLVEPTFGADDGEEDESPRGPAPMFNEGMRCKSGVGRFLELSDDELDVDFIRDRFVAPHSVTSSPKSWRERSRRDGGGGSLHGAPHGTEETLDSVRRLQRMSAFDTHDYDESSNLLEEQIRRDRPKHDYVREEFFKWWLSGLIGVIMGIISFLVDWGIEGLQSAKYNTTEHYINPGTSNFAAPFFIYLAFSLSFGLVAGCLVSYVEPLAAGSGIPELKTYLNGVHLKGLLEIKTLIAKLVGIMFSIASGLIAGKEGPFVHGGGIVGGGIAGLGSMTLGFKFPRKYGGYFRSDAAHRDFTAIGTAAGVATAFSAPIGGMLFTIEEGASWYTTNILWRGFFATCLGVLVLHYLVELKEHPTSWADAHFGTHRDFGLYRDEIALYGMRFWYYGWEIPIFMVIGALGGILGALFIAINVEITKLRQRWIPGKEKNKRLAEVLFIVFITGVVFFLTSYFSPCRTIPAEALQVESEASNSGAGAEGLLSGSYEEFGGAEDFFPQLWCNDGEYSIFGQLFFVPLAEALRLIYHLGATIGGYDFPIEVLLAFFGVVYAFMTWTFGVGAPTGLFVPSLAVGAAFGRSAGRLVAVILPNTEINLQTYAIIGSAASLGGSTRMTISITVLVMETTGALQLLIPIMITVFCAKIFGDYLGLGIYDTHIKIRGAPLLAEYGLEIEQTITCDKLEARNIMTTEIVTMKPQMRVSTLLRMLKQHKHGAFPIAKEASEEEGVPMTGVVLRNQILKQLQYRIGWYKEDKSDFSLPETQNGRYQMQDKLQQIPFKVPKEVDNFPAGQKITEDDMDMMVDFEPFMNRHVYMLTEDTPVQRAYRLFRTLGLRHLFITKSKPNIVGVVTRKDLIEESLSLALGEEAVKAHKQGRKNLPFLPYNAYDRAAASSAPE